MSPRRRTSANDLHSAAVALTPAGFIRDTPMTMHTCSGERYYTDTSEREDSRVRFIYKIRAILYDSMGTYHCCGCFSTLVRLSRNGSAGCGIVRPKA